LDVIICPEVVLHQVENALRIETLRFKSVESRQLIVIIDLNRMVRLVKERKGDKASPVLSHISLPSCSRWHKHCT
jgi:hypothetical protein